MRWGQLVLLVIALSLGLAAQQPVPVPRPAGNGDYWTRNEQPWVEWEVVARDLVARRHAQWPRDWQAPDAPLPGRWDVWRWPEVARFPRGLVVKACLDATGGIIIKDENGDSWLRVYVDESTGEIGFVRANKRYLRPHKSPTATLPVGPPTPSGSETPAPETPGSETPGLEAPESETPGSGLPQETRPDPEPPRQ